MFPPQKHLNGAIICVYSQNGVGVSMSKQFDKWKQYLISEWVFPIQLGPCGLHNISYDFNIC